MAKKYSEYYGAVKPPVRRTGNRVSDESETDSELTRRSRRSDAA